MGHVEPDPRAAQPEVRGAAAVARARSLRGWLSVAALAAASVAGAAEIHLANAWMRPMQTGDKAVPAFVDIKSDVAVTLVGASTPVATSVAIMLDAGSDGTGKPLPAKETTRFEVPAGAGRRLALNGDYLEMRGIRETRLNGARVPLQLTFVDGNGKRIVVDTVATVRGMFPRSALPPDPAY